MGHSRLKVTTFRERFSELLGESDQSTADLAKALHVSRQTVSAWKTGERSPKEPTIIAVARYFRVDEMWLMGFDVEKESVAWRKDETQPAGALSRSDLDRLEALHRNPRLGMLFDRTSKMKPEDVEYMLRFADGILKDQDGDV